MNKEEKVEIKEEDLCKVHGGKQSAPGAGIGGGTDSDTCKRDLDRDTSKRDLDR